MTNRLARETSPYLLQHADNPVDWYPWGDEALARARAEDKPILLSIGYSACHWCHVMAHESFENPDTAGLMNQHFVNVKVDREERPDLDSIYMEAVQAMTGSGGWPLTVFLTPDGKPFFGGTYYPPQDRPGLAGFPRILSAVADAYRQRRQDIERGADKLVAALTRETEAAAPQQPLTADILSLAYRGLRQAFDSANGGFGDAPKFPQPMLLDFLLRYYHRTGDTAARDMVRHSLESMARGGIYDHLGGGFHRYATDSRWLIPHFEKMLYDNALLAQAYLHGYIVTGAPFFRRIAEETLDYVLREMTDPQGGFYSSQDADTEGVEGKYYVWTPEEIAEVIGPDLAAVFNQRFGVTREGNFEGSNVLHVAVDIREEDATLIEQARAALLQRRQQRVAPGRDDKVIASWNGLMLAGMAEAACVLERPDYLAAAVANGSFLLGSMTADGNLKHTYGGIDGFLQDYALVIEGLLTLHQATFGGKWLSEAVRLGDIMVELFWDEEAGKFYDASHQHRGLFVRPSSAVDAAMPSGPAAATMALLKLAKLTADARLEQVAARSLRGVRDPLSRQPLGFGHWLCALDFYLSQPREIAMVGPREHPAIGDLLRTLCGVWSPNKVVAALDPADRQAATGVRLLQDRPMVNGQPTAYVCRGYVCQAPVSDAASLEALLG